MRTVIIQCFSCKEWTTHTYDGLDLLLGKVKCEYCENGNMDWRSTKTKEGGNG